MAGVEKVEISEQYAQEQISGRLPIVKSYRVLGKDVEVIVDSFTVDFQDGDNLGVIAHVVINTDRGKMETTVRAVGTPYYEPSEMAFYYEPSHFEFGESHFFKKNTTRDSVAKKKKSKLAGIVGKSKILQHAQVLAKSKIQNFNNEIKHQAKDHLEGVMVKMLQKHPVKRLDSLQGTILNLGIEDIGVENDILYITVSMLKITYGIMAFALIFLSLVFLALYAPWLLEVLGFLGDIASAFDV